MDDGQSPRRAGVGPRRRRPYPRRVPPHPFCGQLLHLGGPPATVRRLRAYVFWNVLGLLDILFVVATAARLAFAAPASMEALLRLPLSLLPTFLVPLIITSHVLLAIRLARAGAARSAPEAA